ncbi:TPA: LysR family substrate-binding domain-containing protein [Burkholderia lata]
MLLHVRRLFATLEQARDGVAAVASGYSGTLHIAVSDGAIGPKLSALLARCREEEPEVEVRLNEVSLTAQVRGLRDGHFDAGFARSADVGIGIVTEPVWKNAISVAVPARHPLLAHREVPLLELVRYPIVACAPHVFEGCYSELTRLFRSIDAKPIIAGHAASVDMQLVLVAAGYGVGLTALAHTPAIWQHPGVIARPLQGTDNVLTTYLLRAEGLPSATLDRFTARVRAVEGDELS